MAQSLILALAAFSRDLFAILVLRDDPLGRLNGLNIAGKRLHGVVVAQLGLFEVEVLLGNLIVRLDLVVC